MLSRILSLLMALLRVAFLPDARLASQTGSLRILKKRRRSRLPVQTDRRMGLSHDSPRIMPLPAGGRRPLYRGHEPRSRAGRAIPFPADGRGPGEMHAPEPDFSVIRAGAESTIPAALLSSTAGTAIRDD